MAEHGAVRDHDIGARWDLPPPLAARLAARQVERPATKLGLPRAAVNGDAVDDRRRVAQVLDARCLLQHRTARGGIEATRVAEAAVRLVVRRLVEGQVVIASDHDLAP
eukprot:5743346-Prymnesium_polylepis.2